VTRNVGFTPPGMLVQPWRKRIVMAPVIGLGELRGIVSET
jgi:hypothetical protein